jgi:outer membrane protein OmpA-like peptidoglycan-associated protein
MSSASTTASHPQSTFVTTRRYTVRRDPPLWPFVWRGLLPLLGLLLLGWYALAPFARNDVEAVVREHTRKALDVAGFQWVNLAVSGQAVTLTGTQPRTGAGDEALALARLVACPTWLGERLCAVSVVGRFGEVPAAAPAPVTEPASSPAPAASAPAAEAVAAAQACEGELAALLASSQVRFASGRADILADSRVLLDKLAQAARSCPGKLRIEGHTDDRGDARANHALSEARAAAVRDALVARGLGAERMESVGYGADQPVADNTTAEGRAMNRRIELRAVLDR